MVLFVDMLSATVAGSFPLMLHAFSNCAMFLQLSIKPICKTCKTRDCRQTRMRFGVTLL